jgi:hypothetical protein
VIKAVFTPAHTNALKALLNEPLTSTLNHSTTKGEVLVFKVLVANMLMMGLKVSLHLRERLQIFSLSQFCIHKQRKCVEDTLMLSMSEQRTPVLEPAMSLQGTPIQQCSCRSPEMARRMIEVKNANGAVGEALSINPPKSSPPTYGVDLCVLRR